MPENSEQQNINPESNSSEQELNLEQQGQKLAAQIKDMRAKAETKEELAAVQAKIAELRNMFETKLAPGEYRDISVIVRELLDVVDDPDWAEDLTWDFMQPGLSTNRDLGEVLALISVFPKETDLKKLHYQEFPETRLNGMDLSGRYMGMLRLEYELHGHKARLLFNENDLRLGIEIEPEPFQDFVDVGGNIIKKLNTFRDIDKWQCTIMDMGNRLIIDMDSDFTNETNITSLDFNKFPPNEIQYLDIGPDSNQPRIRKVLSEINNVLNGRKVRSYLIKDKWFIEVEPNKDREPEDLAVVVENMMRKVPFGITSGTLGWRLSADRKYFLSIAKIPTRFADTEELFRQPTDEEIYDYEQVSLFTKEGIGLESMVKEIKKDNKRAVSIKIGSRWLIKLVD